MNLQTEKQNNEIVHLNQVELDANNLEPLISQRPKINDQRCNGMVCKSNNCGVN